MNIEGTLEAVAGCGLPPELKDYLGRFIRLEADSSLRRALKAEPSKVLKNMEALLLSASGVLGLPAAEALSKTDFDCKNLDHDRLESALAELRVVNLLDGEGFADIEMIPKGKGKTADISASLRGESFVFEVRCVNGDNKRFPSDSFIDIGEGAKDEAVNFFAGIYKKKIRQARVMSKKAGYGRRGTFIVINPVGFFIPTESWGLDDMAMRVYAEVGRPSGEHVCLVSGGAAAFHPPFRLR